MKKFFITGGAGFIGAHLSNRLLDRGYSVTVYDDLSNGKVWHFGKNQENPRLNIIVADVRDENKLEASMNGHDAVFHLASNADIAKG